MRVVLPSLSAFGVFSFLVASPTFAIPTLTYQFTTDQSVYTVAANGIVNVNVYLQETATGGSPSLLSVEYGDGLTDFLVNTNVMGTGNMSVLSQTRNTAFDGNEPTSNNLIGQNITNGGAAGPSAPGGAGLFGITNFEAGNVSATFNGSVATVLLGTLTIQASATPTTTTFLLSDNDTGSNNQDFATYGDFANDTNYYVLNLPDTDPSNVAASAPTFTTDLPDIGGLDGASFTVEVAGPAPEPASLAILTVGSFGLLVRKRRKG